MLVPRIGHRPAVIREPHVASWYAPSFSDALGDRLLLCDNTSGDALEMLRLRAHLTRQPEFEARLRAQALILRGFRSPAFAAVHSIERLEDTGNALAVVSSHVAGVRLSEVLHRAGQQRRAIPIDAALFIVRQLVHAVAELHAHAAGLTHGALSPERVVLTESGTVMVVEHVLGAALAELHYDRQRFWSELRLGTLPGTLAATIDPRTDVLQIGLVALSTILGRSLVTDDFPQAIDSLLYEADDVLEEGRQYSRESVFVWLERALQQSPSSFGSAIEAANALVDWYDVSRTKSRTGPASRPERSWSQQALLNPAAPTSSTFGASAVSFAQGSQPSALRRIFKRIGRYARTSRRIWIPVSAAAASLAGTLAVVGHPAATDGLGALVIATIPGGATVRIDGRHIGVTPVRQALEPGTYELEVARDREIRRFTVVLRPNQELTQYIEMRRGQEEGGRDQPSEARADRPPQPEAPLPVPGLSLLPASAAPGSAGPRSLGSLRVSSPVDVEVFHGGRLIGIGGSKDIPVPPGRLVLDLVNRELDFRTTTTIAITPGQQHTLAVALPKGVLHVNAQPWAEVWIDGERLGETPVGNISLSLGRHKVVFQHPDLGTTSREVIIKASGQSRLAVDLRRPGSQ